MSPKEFAEESAAPENANAPENTNAAEVENDGGAVGAVGGDGGGGRAGLVIAAVLLLACGGLVGYGLLDTEDEPEPPATRTAAVTYEVTGDGPAEISYLGRDTDGAATVIRDAELPWKRTVQVPLGQAPTVAVVLGEKGGQAACTLAVRGKHLQSATAAGEFGRATCAAGQLSDGG
ncbi:hypothetical protein CNQ36_22610 [Streptomyces fungicidicus]|uniref:MmpS family membrane protein n=1 Tax=Streptomyces fungicidicus TaxID=68203 RepID=A0A494UZX9_9ACTN|nr:hypothetical protein CNQ36_22610 [Streptomyces fungicidicus]